MTFLQYQRKQIQDSKILRFQLFSFDRPVYAIKSCLDRNLMVITPKAMKLLYVRNKTSYNRQSRKVLKRRHMKQRGGTFVHAHSCLLVKIFTVFSRLYLELIYWI